MKAIKTSSSHNINPQYIDNLLTEMRARYTPEYIALLRRDMASLAACERPAPVHHTPPAMPAVRRGVLHRLGAWLCSL